MDCVVCGTPTETRRQPEEFGLVDLGGGAMLKLEPMTSSDPCSIEYARRQGIMRSRDPDGGLGRGEGPGRPSGFLDGRWPAILAVAERLRSRPMLGQELFEIVREHKPASGGPGGGSTRGRSLPGGAR
jgi:hypothetical protein